MKKNIKAGLVTPYPPSKTTLNEYGYHLASHLASKVEVKELQLYVEDINASYVPDYPKQRFIPCWKFNSLANIVNLVQAIRQNKPDVVILNLQFLIFGDKKVAAALGLMLPMVLKMLGIKTMVLLHNIMEEVDLSKAGISQNKVLNAIYGFIGNILTRMILQADIVGVTIEKYVDVLRSKYHVKNVVLLPHGTFETPDEPTYERKEGPLQVMTFGKFGTYKKVEVLIEAVEEVRNQTNLDIEIVVAGTDNPNVPGYLAGVQEKYSHVPQVRFTGYVEEEDVPVIFGDSAIVVFPYTSTTGSSGVLHQAGSYGKAAILTNIGDLALLIEEEGFKGEYFEPDDKKTLAAAIKKLLTDDDYRNKIERANFAAASSLSLEDIADWYLIHMERLLGADSISPKHYQISYAVR